MPSVEHLDFKDIKGFTEKKVKLVRDAAKRAALEAAQRGRAFIVQRVMVSFGPQELGAVPVDQGLYRNAWKAIRLSSGARLMNDSPYAGVIEDGRRPGGKAPPVELMRAWVRRKFSGQMGWKRRRMGPLREGAQARADAQEAEINSIAFLISRHIVKYGIPPKHVLKSAIPHVKEFLKEALAQQLSELSSGSAGEED